MTQQFLSRCIKPQHIDSLSIKPHHVILAAMCVVQLVILLVYGWTPYHDTLGYVKEANTAMGDGALYPSRAQVADCYFIWNVGAINLVQLSLLLTGSLWPAMLFDAALKVAGAAALYSVTATLYSRSAALLALCLMAVYPATYDAGSLLSEPPFVSLVIISLYFLLRGQRMAAGILLAVANMIRPMGICFVIAYAVFLLLNRQERLAPQTTLRTALKAVGRLVGGYVLGIALIAGGHKLNSGHYIYQARTGWMALLQYTWDHSSATTRQSYLASHGSDPNIIADTTLNALQRDSVWRQRCLAYIAFAPTDYVSQMPMKVAATFVSDNPNMCNYMGDKHSREELYDEISMPQLFRQFPRYSGIQWLTVANLLVYYLLLLAFIINSVQVAGRFCREGRIPSRHSLPLLVFVLCVAVLVVAGHGEARFHQPIMPFVIMSAAQCFLKTLGRRQKSCH